ncbi:hypothetical protein B0I35DRAFT_21326 [Stachybotrys elegans]|uniref:Uncharacterized protein n=1 Tax=Stachybotrys elegans TaxID=80388 RepID=A0A8K0T731_9HYPO|nr:hypothetical protein B0I35DRAFT_21326 [Stachybotrys elegans]
MAPTLRRSAAADKAESEVDEAIAASIVAPAAVVVAASEHVPSAQRPRVELPAAAQFPITVLLSFAAASMGYSVLGELSKGELAAVTRTQETWQEVGLLATWRVLELTLGWFGGLDSLDVALMDLLSHGPSLYLLVRFYTLSPATAISALAIDVVSAAVPFYLFRPLSDVHRASPNLPNRELLDAPLQLYTTALSSVIYSVTLVLSLRFLLPRIFVLYFSHIPTLEPAYAASYTSVLPVTLLFGAAASLFIFAPFATTGKAKEDDKIGEFDPAEASLGQTVWWNFWGYTAKAKVVIRRTALITVLTGVNTYLNCTMNIYGVEPTGAAIYSLVWVVAALFTGMSLGLVGEDE